MNGLNVSTFVENTPVEKAIRIGSIEDFAREKRRKLFERVSLFGSIVSFLHFLEDLFAGAKEAPLFDISITVALVICYGLHKIGYFNTARIIGLTFLNLFLTIYACIVPPDVGVFLFFFPLMAIAMGVFSKSENVIRIFFVALSALLQISLFLTDFDLIGPYEIDAPNVEMFFMINLASSAFMLVVSINFIINVNEESEKRLHLLAEEVKTKNINLEKTNAELDRFFYSTSHDLRSPLLSIKGLVNIAKHDTADPKMQQYLLMMTERADKLDLFINDIIDYSKNTRTEITHDRIDVDLLLEEVRENFRFLEGASKIAFRKEVNTPEMVTDRSRVTVILNNLISNAIKYHNTDQDQPWIKVSVDNSNGTLHVVVSDNGPGIDADKQTKIFDMFYRGTELSKGSGLGLYIVKETVEKMNGTISVDSTEGEGTSFIVSLPVSSNGIA